jgi:tRNA/rRNA methyltransferase
MNTVRTSKKQPLASAGEIERITVLLLESLRASGYLSSNSKSASEARIRRLVRRLNLPADDAELWLGIFRQIAWKANKTTLAPGS